VLERRHRLTTSAGFTAATRRGRRAGTRTLVLHLLDPEVASVDGPGRACAVSSSTGMPLVGFVVSKAVGGAVDRNRVKRRLRHLVRERLEGLPASAVLVVRALPAATTATYGGLGRDLDAALRRLDLPAGTVTGR
jgi:ribonuclease P protein component